jgi:hypothetical protein
MDETLLNEEITLTRADLKRMCRDAYDVGYYDGKRLYEEQSIIRQQDQFEFDTITYNKIITDRY